MPCASEPRLEVHSLVGSGRTLHIVYGIIEEFTEIFYVAKTDQGLTIFSDKAISSIILNGLGEIQLSAETLKAMIGISESESTNPSDANQGIGAAPASNP